MVCQLLMFYNSKQHQSVWASILTNTSIKYVTYLRSPSTSGRSFVMAITSANKVTKVVMNATGELQKLKHGHEKFYQQFGNIVHRWVTKLDRQNKQLLKFWSMQLYFLIVWGASFHRAVTLFIWLFKPNTKRERGRQLTRFLPARMFKLLLFANGQANAWDSGNTAIQVAA